MTSLDGCTSKNDSNSERRRKAGENAMTTQDQVLNFITNNPPCGGLTARELSGGLQLPIEEVRSAVEALVATREIRAVDDTLPTNYQRYVLASATVPAAVTPDEPWRSPEEIWSAEAQKKHRAELAAKRPPQPRRFEPSEEQISQAMTPAPPLTPEERETAKRLGVGRVIRNPQEFIRG
jgi:hypothetical protein